MWKGKLVGKDSSGNRYYVEKGRPRRGAPRRWVIYVGAAEASKVPADWHAWLHYTTDEIPSGDAPRRPWQKQHTPNLTGTTEAYRPPGHEYEGGRRDHATGDYEAWRPS